MSLSEKILEAAVEVIKNYEEEELTQDDVVGSLLTVAMLYGKEHCSKEQLLSELGIQMAIISKREPEMLEQAIRELEYRATMLNMGTETALLQGAMQKIGKA